MNFIKKALLGSLLVLPLFSFGFDIKTGEEVKIDEQVNGDFYVAGGEATISQPINGDLVIAGGASDIDENVSGDLLVFGGTINVNGIIQDDARLVGGTIIISKNIGGDLIIFGGNVKIKEGVIIYGDLLVFGGKISLEGNVEGNAKIAAGKISLYGSIAGSADITTQGDNEGIVIGEDASIGGNLMYEAMKKNEGLEKIVAGSIQFKQGKDYHRNYTEYFINPAKVYRLLFLILFGSLMVFNFDKIISGAAQILVKHPWKSFFTGLLIYACIPFIVLLLLISVLGIPFGLMLLFIYIFMFVLYKLINVIVFAGLFIDKLGGYKKVCWWKKLGIVIGLSILSILLGCIDLIALFFAAGAMFTKKMELLKKVL